jgi:dTDP-L-rhamnose 4-epimerase
MSKVLITGGAGFIGSNLALYLLKQGFEITVLDSLSHQIHTPNPELYSPLYNSIKDKVNFIMGSVEDKELLYKAIGQNDIIIHYAAETGTGQSMYEINKYNDVNIGGTANLLDLLTNRVHNVKKVVVASSRSIYGEGKYFSKIYGNVYPEARLKTDLDAGFFEPTYKDDNDLTLLATDEDSKIHPSSFYGITKQVQEQMIMTLCPNIGISPIALRYQNVYGPGQSLSNPYTGILSIFSNLILNNKAINIFEDGNESRDFVFISDVVEATFQSIVNEHANNHIFNVGFGTNTSVLEITTLLYKIYNKEPNFTISGNYRLGDIRHNFADLTKLNTILNYEPKVSIDKGLQSFCNWVLGQNISELNFENTIDEMKRKGLLK